MKISTKLLLLGCSCFVLINVFEAAQQHYYITRFQLNGSADVSFWELLKNHVLRWLIWGIFAFLLVKLIRKKLIRHEHFQFTLIGKYVSLILLATLISLLSISSIQLVLDQAAWSELWEYFQFFTFQKAALFTSAYLGLLILIHLHAHQAALELKVVELSSLKKENKQLYQELKTQAFQDSAPLIHVKIGNKLKAILLADILWIQSEDYCVRLHVSSGQSYLLRKSMKALERELSSQGFLRIHRNSLVNIAQIESYTFQDEAQVALKQGQVLKIATSRIPQIKKALASSISTDQVKT